MQGNLGQPKGNTLSPPFHHLPIVLMTTEPTNYKDSIGNVSANIMSDNRSLESFRIITARIVNRSNTDASWHFVAIDEPTSRATE